MTEKDIVQIRNDILTEMYSEAEPPLDFENVLENPEEYSEGWYKKHYLSDKRQTEILEKHLDKHDLSHGEKQDLVWSTILDYGPTNTSDPSSNKE